MEEEKEETILILGQGLSGTCLALNLAMQGRNFRIIASDDRDCASEKAAGLMNPVTGRRMALTWNFGQVWPSAIQFYQKALAFLGASDKQLFSKKTIRKALHSTEEMNFLEAKSAWAGFGDLIKIRKAETGDQEIFYNLAGWAETLEGGRLDVAGFLSVARDYFRQTGSFSEGIFQLENLKKNRMGWEFEGKRYRHVVSCLGLGCPWVSPELWAVKGQVYTLVGLPDWGSDIIKTEHFLIPLEKGQVLAGSTYEREFDHNQPDKEGFKTITAEISPELLSKITVTASRSGIRPTTKDRRPVIRKIEPGLFAINGLGSKGVSLAPFLAGELLSMPDFQY